MTVRETFEASLLVGIVLALVRHAGRPPLARAVWAGALSAGVLSILAGALLVATLGDLHGRARELVEGLLMWVAAGMLTYVLWWMGRHARDASGRLRGEATALIEAGSTLALVALVFVSTQAAAVILIAGGFAGSAVLLTSILRNQSGSGRRALAAALPLGALLVLVLFAWLHWYASGEIVDVT